MFSNRKNYNLGTYPLRSMGGGAGNGLLESMDELVRGHVVEREGVEAAWRISRHDCDGYSKRRFL